MGPPCDHLQRPYRPRSLLACRPKVPVSTSAFASSDSGSSCGSGLKRRRHGDGGRACRRRGSAPYSGAHELRWGCALLNSAPHSALRALTFVPENGRKGARYVWPANRTELPWAGREARAPPPKPRFTDVWSKGISYSTENDSSHSRHRTRHDMLGRPDHSRMIGADVASGRTVAAGTRHKYTHHGVYTCV